MEFIKNTAARFGSLLLIVCLAFLGTMAFSSCDNKDEVIPRRLYALQARANLEYQFTKRFGVFATGGYGLTRFYNKSSNYDKGAIIEAGIILF